MKERLSQDSTVSNNSLTEVTE